MSKVHRFLSPEREVIIDEDCEALQEKPEIDSLWALARGLGIKSKPKAYVDSDDIPYGCS
jgi:hypothetical protein